MRRRSASGIEGSRVVLMVDVHGPPDPPASRKATLKCVLNLKIVLKKKISVFPTGISAIPGPQHLFVF